MMEEEVEHIAEKWIIESGSATSETDSGSSDCSSSSSSDGLSSAAKLSSSSSYSSSSTSSSSSSSSSSSTSSGGGPEKKRARRNSIRGFVEITVPSYAAVEFQRHFRLSRETVYDLIHQFQASDHLPVHTNGPMKLTHETALLMTLWYLANMETFRQCSDRFDISFSSAHRILNKTLNFIISLCGKYIRWPNASEALKIKEDYKKKHNIDGIIGSIDGCHIEIRRPEMHEEVYVNRKGYHSIILQGIVDSTKRFIDVYIGEAGSLHDARVLRRSPIYEHAADNLNLFHGGFLLGDSAYPKLPWLVPPFKDCGNLTREQRIFNFRHSSCRIVVEHTFGLLKTLFRRLLRFDNLSIKIITKCVLAACILHNIRLQQGFENDEGINIQNELDVAPDAPADNNVINDRRQDVFEKMFN